MPRIVGIDVDERKKVKVALTAIFGVGPHIALQICERVNIDPEIRVRELSEREIGQINNDIQDHVMVEGDLKRQVAQDIKRLQAINSYRGLRHRRGLPARGQRTKTNARTRKGRKQTVGAIRDKAMRKQARNDA